MFVGRKKELDLLNDLKNKVTASLAVITGRRRIGKSRLAEEFGKHYQFYSFSGFPPAANTTQEEQRRNFSLQIEKYWHIPVRYDSWYELFRFLAMQIKGQNTVVLLDEISWMGSEDSLFLGALKTVWDQEFSKIDSLVLLLCGSISSWIEKNILSNTGFVGRVSLKINVQELSLTECSEFWKGAKASAYEVFKILSVTGGVPRYLEEVNFTKSAQDNIKSLCFNPGGILFNEFNQIFSDLFESKYEIYKKIVLSLIDGPKSLVELSRLTNLPQNGVFSGYLEDLEKAGFIARSYAWSLKAKKRSNLSNYRISDNYIRFYLKYIFPNSGRIEQGHFEDITLENLPQWTSIMGLQFENLIIHNRSIVLKELNIRPGTVINDGPYFQRSTKKHQGCQIDYMIQTNLNELYIVEIKFSRKELIKTVVSAIEDKIDCLIKPKAHAIRPVLVHVNGVAEDLEDTGYFFKILDFSKMLTLE